MLFCVRCGTDSLQARRVETIVVGDKNCGQRRRSRAAVAKLQATWGQPPRSLVPNRSRGLGSFSCVAGESVASVKSSQRVGYVVHVSKLWFPKQCGRKLHFCCPGAPFWCLVRKANGVPFVLQVQVSFCLLAVFVRTSSLLAMSWPSSTACCLRSLPELSFSLLLLAVFSVLAALAASWAAGSCSVGLSSSCCRLPPSASGVTRNLFRKSSLLRACHNASFPFRPHIWILLIASFLTSSS